MFGLNFKHLLLPDVHTPHHFIEIVTEGTHAVRPAAGMAGRLYWEIDTHTLFKDNGTAWLELWRAEDVIRLIELYENSHSSLTGITASQHHVKTIADELNLADMAEKSHNSLTDVISGIIFNLGLATVGTKQAQALIPGSLTISKVKIYADTAPTGASLIVDVNKNGSTIFTTQGNRPQIAIGGHADDSGTPNITSLSAGDRLSVDIDQVGSSVPGGNDLLVVIVCS